MSKNQSSGDAAVPSPAATLHSREFALDFLSHICRVKPFSRMHEESFARYDLLAARWPDPLTREGSRFAMAAPRGSAKSTIHTLVFPLMDICSRRERYIVILSATLAQAAARLRNIRRELAANPDLQPLIGNAMKHREIWNRQSICLNGVQVDAFGSGAEIRGLGYAEARPTKIILDDVEDSIRVLDPRGRAMLAAWYDEVVENLGDTYTRIEIIGTILHHDSLLARLMKRPGFESHMYRSIESWAERQDLWDEWRTLLTNPALEDSAEAASEFFKEHSEEMLRGTRVLWQARESYDRLMFQLVTHGRQAFFKEKQNEPADASARGFDPARWRRFTLAGGEMYLHAGRDGEAQPGESGMARISAGDLMVFGFIDPATGRGRANASGDYAAIATVGRDPRGTLYVLDVWLRRASPREQVHAIFDLHEQWNYACVGIEINGGQSFLAEQIAEERVSRGTAMRIPLCEVCHKHPKQARIWTLEPLAANGSLVFSRHLPDEFLAEAEAFPNGRHDDGLDALAGAVELAARHNRTAGIRAAGPRGFAGKLRGY